LAITTILSALFNPINTSRFLKVIFGFVGGLIAIVVLILIIYIVQLFVAMKKQRDEVRIIMDSEEKKRQSPLKVSPPIMQYVSNTGNHAILLKVENTSNVPIQGVYGKITGSKSLPTDSGLTTPIEPIVPYHTLLEWQGGKSIQTIAVGSSCNLIIAIKRNDWAGTMLFFGTETETHPTNVITPLVLNIEIGSDTLVFEPQVVQITLFWDNSNFLNAELTKGIIPRQYLNGI
jgi:hypothetical protein